MRQHECHTTRASPFSSLYRGEVVQERNSTKDSSILPAITLDAQICTKKNVGNFERVLLFRFYDTSSQVTGVIVDDVLMNNCTHSWASIDQIWNAAEMLKSIKDEWGGTVHQTTGSRVSPQMSTPSSIASKFGRIVGSPMSFITTRAPTEMNDSTVEANKISCFVDYPALSYDVSAINNFFMDVVHVLWRNRC